MRKFAALRVVAFAVAAVAFAGVRAEAALITLNPSSQSASINDLVNVDIMVSGLTADEAVGGVSLILSFNPAILSGVSYTNDPDSKMGFSQCEAEAAGDPFEPTCEFSFGFDGGAGSPLDLFFLANDELDAPDLKALQGASFRLATVTFLAIGPGLTQLVLSTVGEFLSNSDGLTPILAQATNGEVCVGDDCGIGPAPIPEPSTWALFGAGALALLARRLRRTA